MRPDAHLIREIAPTGRLRAALNMGNPVLARLVGDLFDGRHGPMTSRMSRRAENAHTWEVALEEHEANRVKVGNR